MLFRRKMEYRCSRRSLTPAASTERILFGSWLAVCRSIRVAPQFADRSLNTSRQPVQRRAIIVAAAGHHPTDRGRVGDIGKRVGIEEHQVGQLARRDRAERIGGAEEL